MMVSFYVRGELKAQARPRAFAFKRADGTTKVRVYDSNSAEGWKSAIAEAARRAGLVKFDGPVDLRLFFSFSRPKSHFKTGNVRESAPRFHLQKPDLDNLVKAVLDALTTLGAWRDDKQVTRLSAEKSWAIGSAQGGCHISFLEMR